MRHEIPATDWHVALAQAIRNANSGDIIVVSTDNMKKMAEFAMRRLNRSDLTIEISEPSDS